MVMPMVYSRRWWVVPGLSVSGERVTESGGGEGVESITERRVTEGRSHLHGLNFSGLLGSLDFNGSSRSGHERGVSAKVVRVGERVGQADGSVGLTILVSINAVVSQVLQQVRRVDIGRGGQSNSQQGRQDDLECWWNATVSWNLNWTKMRIAKNYQELHDESVWGGT